MSPDATAEQGQFEPSSYIGRKKQHPAPNLREWEITPIKLGQTNYNFQME